MENNRQPRKSSQKLDFEDIVVHQDCAIGHLKIDPLLERFSKKSLGYIIFSWLIPYKHHPIIDAYFRSSAAIRNEQHRQIRSQYWYLIHPLSKFRLLWDMFFAFALFLFTFHLALLVGFKIEIQKATCDYIHYAINTVMNQICLLDIWFNFFTGVLRQSNQPINMNHRLIAVNYLTGFFLVDFISTLPVTEFVAIMEANEQKAGHTFSARTDPDMDEIMNYHVEITGFSHRYMIDMCVVLKLVTIHRVWKGLAYLTKLAGWSDFQLRMIRLVLTLFLVLHWVICLYKRMIVEQILMIYNINPANLERLSNHQAYIMDISVHFKEKYEYLGHLIIWHVMGGSFATHAPVALESKLFACLNVFTGFMFDIYLIVQILQLMDVIYCSRRKYHEMMNQLEAYMSYKHLPIQMQKRIVMCYQKKYHKSYFRESNLFKTLSEPLRREIMLHRGNIFVERVHILHNQPKRVVKAIVDCLTKEICLPQDVILHAGTYGDCMYFLGIGTVAIMTPTGKEVCHLEDGDHFGEISLFANNDKRTASVVAIDYCEIYRLSREDFRKTVATVPDLYERIKDQALRRMDATVVMEEHHKRRMLLAFSKEGDEDVVRKESMASERLSQDFNMDMSQFEMKDEASENSA